MIVAIFLLLELLLLLFFSAFHVGDGFVATTVPAGRRQTHHVPKHVSTFSPKQDINIAGTIGLEEEHRSAGEVVLPRVAEMSTRATATRLYATFGEEEVVSI